MPNPIESLIGKRFGMLYVVEKASSSERGIMYNCLCDCGNKKLLSAGDLKSGKYKSCGCMKRKDITGEKSGALTAVRATGQRKIIGGNKQMLWECRCECGKSIFLTVGEFHNSGYKSCGCMQYKNMDKRLIPIRKQNIVDDTNLGIIKSKKINKNNTSGVRGVYYNKKTKKWKAGLVFQKKYYHLGYFKIKKDAIKARKTAEVEYFGQYLKNKKDKL
jgi:hypothetical protein